MVQTLLENGNGLKLYRGLVLAGLVGLVAGVRDMSGSIRAINAEITVYHDGTAPAPIKPPVPNPGSIHPPADDLPQGSLSGG